LKELMVSNKQSGFTLVEIIIVLAISSGLAVIIFTGQRGLRSQAQFDAAVNKIVASVNETHNEATAGVNIVGTGDGSSQPAGCAPGTLGTTVFRGTALTVDNAVVGGPLRVDYYRASPGVNACIYDRRVISVPTPVTVTTGGRVLFMRNDTGGLNVCPVALATNVLPLYTSGNCVNGTVTYRFTDADGHVSQVLVDGSGLARRLN
jgi:prepilin-type N-terminal cleavage/methylation domain-containing protein